jgi:hypothetical protein
MENSIYFESIVFSFLREKEIYPEKHCEYCRYSGKYCSATDETEKINDDCLCRCSYFYPKDEFINEYKDD